MRRLTVTARRHQSHRTTTRRCLSHFRVVDHVVPCQHTRHYPAGAENGHENDLKLAVKQYIPHTQPQSTNHADQITLIGAHANGFPKELYEPMWDYLYEKFDARGKSIRSVWIADMAPQGQSGVLNEGVLGNDPSWWDHARDLLFLINQKQGDMPQPLVGVGHSVGASHLAALSLLHPRLFQALVLIDPVIQMDNPSMNFAPASTYRREFWPSRDDAALAFKKSKFYQRWDSRVLNKWIEHGLREVPTELYPEVNEAEDGKVPVTLTTTKAQEVFQYLRPLYKGDPWTDKDLYADFDSEVLKDNDHFYRPEPREIFQRLPEIHPAVRYVFGSQSEFGTPDRRKQKLDSTGSGIGGSGGLKINRVSETVLDCGHLVCMEKPEECADAAANFIDHELERWAARQRKLELSYTARPRRDRVDTDDDWKRNIGPPPERPKKQVSDSSPTPAKS